MGETRRFIDEIEYLLDGLTTTKNTGPRSNQAVRGSIEEIVEKCFMKDKITGEYSVNVGFGMKLKSHGALGIIFESLNDTNDPIVLNNLILLITALLYDVRRLDFFFKPELAIKIAKHCFALVEGIEISFIKMLKCSQIFGKKVNENIEDFEVLIHVAIWILSKWAFSSVTSRTANSTNTCLFFDLLLKDDNLVKRVFEACELFNEAGEKAAGLLDCLLNRKLIKNEDSSCLGLLDKIIKSKYENLVFMKLAVSLSGGSLKRITRRNFFELIENLIKISFPFRGEIEILSLSCLINLIDRSDDSLMDEFRYAHGASVGDDIEETNITSTNTTLQIITIEYCKCPVEFQLHKSLLALILGFICRQNRTNIEVISRTIGNELVFDELKREILSVASNFAFQQQQQQSGEDEDIKMIVDRLNEVISTFKKK